MDLNQIVREQLGRNRILMGNVLKKLEAELEGEPILKMGAGRQGLRNAVVAVTPTRVLVANDKSVDAIPREDVLAIDARSAATGTKLAIRRPAGECTVAAFGPMLRGTEIRDLVMRPVANTGVHVHASERENGRALDLGALPPPSLPAPAGEVVDPLAASAPVTLPPGTTLKDAAKSLERAYKAYRKNAESANRALIQAEKDYAKRVGQARASASDARVPRKIASIGVVRRITLYETRIETPQGAHALTPDVHAHAEQHGNKQVVQGWVIKSNQDRREVYLHVDGPDWAVVVPFSIQHSVSEPRHIHEFAAKVNVAARGVERTHKQVEQRTIAAERQLAATLVRRELVARAATAYAKASHALEEVRGTSALLTRLAPAGMRDRTGRNAAELLRSCRSGVDAHLQGAQAAQARVEQESMKADAERAAIERGLIGPTAPDPSASPEAAIAAPMAAAPAEATIENDVVETLRKLGELRDAGVLTEEEFAAKKAQLLQRL